VSAKQGKCPHGYTVEIRFIVCDTCIALRKAPKRDADKPGPKCVECGHDDSNHYSGGKGKGCVVYLEDASGFCPCDMFVRRKKKSGGTFPPELAGTNRSPRREPSGQKFCEHGVPATKDCVVVGCWNNSETRERPRPILRLMPLREIVNAAADEIEAERKRGRVKARRSRTRAEQKRSPKAPEPPPLTGRAPRAHDGEEV
jgi:hypothetical protein